MFRAVPYARKYNMEEEKEKSILPLDYDEDDSSEEEEDDEIFDNSKVDWRVKGNLLRGKEFSVSENGNCPRCQSNIIVFVILDELFPMGDMPEILYNLLAKGKAVLWSSQDKQSCKKSPTFMCKGFCPSDPLGAGFNINWDTVNLTKLLKDLLKLNATKAQKKLQESAKAEAGESQDEEVNEKDIIRVMLAKEKEKGETAKPVQGPLKEDEAQIQVSVSSSETVASTSTTPVTTTATTPSATTYPVSKDGSCPHCESKDVRYIILVKESTKDIKLPPTLDKLLTMGKAFKMAKGANSPPSFQCLTCTYGFNLDWSSTNLKKIFNLENEATVTTSATAATAKTSTAASTMYEMYTATSYPTSAYQTSSYVTSAYTQPPPIGYATPAVPYGYPVPTQHMGLAPPMIHAPPMASMAPPPYGAAPMSFPATAPQPYPGLPPPGLPPQPYVPTSPQFIHGPPAPVMCVPPQPFPGGPLNQFGPVQPFPNVPLGAPNPLMGGPTPFMGGPPAYGIQPGGANMPGNMYFHGSVRSKWGPTPGNMQGPRTNMQRMPRLRLPMAAKGVKGRKKNRKGSSSELHEHNSSDSNLGAQQQWYNNAAESVDNEGEEDTTRDVYDPEAATRFEELLNKIDGDQGDGDHEDEKPPGEESQAEFEVAAFSPEEKPADPAENIAEDGREREAKALGTSETTPEKTEPMQVDTTTLTTVPESTKISEATHVSEEAKPPGNNSQANVTRESNESEGEEPGPTTAPRTKAGRGRKRQATGGRKKATNARNTRTKKTVKDIEGSQHGVGINNDTNGLAGTEEAKKAKIDSVISLANTEAEESGENKSTQEDVAVEEEPTPKRVTRARSRRK